MLSLMLLHFSAVHGSSEHVLWSFPNRMSHEDVTVASHRILQILKSSTKPNRAKINNAELPLTESKFCDSLEF